MARLGKISLQATNESDLFLNEEVYLDGVTSASEMATMISEPGFDQDKGWVAGSKGKEVSVNIDGDTAVIYGCFKGESFTAPFMINIYIQYEENDDLFAEEEK